MRKVKCLGIGGAQLLEQWMGDTTARAGTGQQHVCCDGAWSSVKYNKTAHCFPPLAAIVT